MSDVRATVPKKKELQIRYCLAGNVELAPKTSISWKSRDSKRRLIEKDRAMLRTCSGGEGMKIVGVIQKGVGQGALFTRLDWVMEQFEKAMGAKPFPGTLNVRVCDEDVDKIDAFFAVMDFQIIPIDADYCSASLKKVWVNGILGAAVFPSSEVHVHGKEIIEIMSAYSFKEALHLHEGDRVILSDPHENCEGERK